MSIKESAEQQFKYNTQHQYLLCKFHSETKNFRPAKLFL